MIQWTLMRPRHRPCRLRVPLACWGNSYTPSCSQEHRVRGHSLGHRAEGLGLNLQILFCRPSASISMATRAQRLPACRGLGLSSTGGQSEEQDCLPWPGNLPGELLGSRQRLGKRWSARRRDQESRLFSVHWRRCRRVFAAARLLNRAMRMSRRVLAVTAGAVTLWFRARGAAGWGGERILRPSHERRGHPSQDMGPSSMHPDMKASTIFYRPTMGGGRNNHRLMAAATLAAVAGPQGQQRCLHLHQQGAAATTRRERGGGSCKSRLTRLMRMETWGMSG